MEGHPCELYEPLERGKVRCTACSHYCRILPGQSGICGIRQNQEGKLFLLVYGKAAAVNLDPVGKKPLFHFLPGSSIFSLGTIGCNFGCSFCQNWDISQAARSIRTRLMKDQRPELQGVEVTKFGYDLPPKRIVELCLGKAPSIAYTYNEPVVFYEYLRDTAELAHKKGLKNVMVSSGYESEEAMLGLHGLIDAMNIDLKGFTDEFYRQVCLATLEPVLRTIRRARELGIWVEVTTLVIPGKNDSDDELRGIAEFLASVDRDMPWHLTAFHPDYKMQDIRQTPLATLKRGYRIGKDAGLHYVYLGNVMDEEHSSTFCPECHELLIARQWHDIRIASLRKGTCGKCGHAIPGVWA